MTDVEAPETAGVVRAAVVATYLAFIATGFSFASWASRIPQVRDRLELSPAGLGFVLLAIAVGSLIALPLSGPIVTLINSRRTVTAMALLQVVALVVVAIGHRYGVAPLVCGLFLFGFTQGAWDVAMNVQGAIVERRLGKAIMPRFHAGFSVGTVAGALVGSAMVALHVGVMPHLVGVAMVIAVAVPLGVRRFVPDTDEESASVSAEPAQRAWAAWTEPRTLLVGVFVLAFAFAEGTGNDWTSIALIDGYGVRPAIGTLGFAVFLAAMTIGRWVGPGVLDRYGRVSVVRGLAVLGIVGLVMFVVGPHPALAFVGAVLWGAGTSLGFPVGMSAGADDPRRAAARVSVIASVGYCAFLAGPPLVGFLGDHLTVRKAVTVVAVVLALSAAIAGAVREPERESASAR